MVLDDEEVVRKRLLSLLLLMMYVIKEGRCSDREGEGGGRGAWRERKDRCGHNETGFREIG